ncbi:MAG: hypothetical protein AAB114_04580 [Chloroflexota bacterium]
MRAPLIAPPRIGIALERVAPVRPGAWRIGWRVRGDPRDAVAIVEAWHPHGSFRSSRRRPALRIPPRRSGILELPARCDAPPGSTIENAFLILRVSSRGSRWRYVVRLRVRVGSDGTPRPAVEAVDAFPARR